MERFDTISQSRKAIFLDKDGTLIPDIPYNVQPELVCLSRSSVKGLKKLMDEGYQLIVISNQSGIGKGFFTENDLLFVEKKIDQLLRKHGIYLSGFYYCPHDADGVVAEYAVECDCRKPKAGLLFEAAQAHRISLSESWMIGDILNDVEAGNAAGCGTILINNGNETEWNMSPERTPDFMVQNINQAADYILGVYNRERQDESKLSIVPEKV